MTWTWIITIAALVGVVANIKKWRWCFYVWGVTNLAWMIVNLHIQLYSAALLWFVYFLTCVWGIIAWSKKPKTVEIPIENATVAWDEAEEIVESLNSMSHSELKKCRESIKKRAERIMQALDSYVKEEDVVEIP